MLRASPTVAAVSALVTVVTFPPGAAAAPRHRTLHAATIAALLSAGRPVVHSGVIVEGDLRLPPDVRRPLVLRNSTFHGRVSGASSSFAGLVDLSSSTFRRGFDFSDARFDGPLLFVDAHVPRGKPARFTFADFGGAAVFGGANFEGGADFAGAAFHGVSRFHKASFGNPTSFGLASFDDVADFSSTSFNGRASFGGTEFRSVVDFSSASFNGETAFTGTRFFGAADFAAAMFTPARGGANATSFADAHFDGGASFLSAFFDAGASFALAGASRDLDFESASFEGDANFTTVRFGNVDFSLAEVTGLLNFDQAVVTRLDLDRATLSGRLVLPNPTLGSGRIDDLRMDPADVGRVRAGNARETRASRERALALVETASRSGGDLRAADEARVRRLTLERRDEAVLLRPFDWALYWGVSGYFVRPSHPLLAILALMIVGALVRLRHAGRADLAAAPRGFADALGSSLSSLWRFRLGEGSAALQAEAVLYKLLFAVLLINLGNVWPPVSDILKGVLP